MKERERVRVSTWDFLLMILQRVDQNGPAQNILPEQTFAPLYGGLLSCHSELHSAEQLEELGDVLH